jgi:D-alanine-D-alanine ligase
MRDCVANSPEQRTGRGVMPSTLKAPLADSGSDKVKNDSDPYLTQLQHWIECLKPHVRVAIIFGGDNSAPGSVVYQSHNARSWKSYEAVAQDIAASLARIGFRHVRLIPDDMHLGDRLRREGIHIAWLNSGGVQGYNSAAHASSMLEMLGVPYVGHDPLAATTLDNKHAFKRQALCAGLPTAPFSIWHMARGVFRPELNTRFQRVFDDYCGPFVVKPVSGRASLHVSVIDTRDELADAIARVYEATADEVLIEKYLPGREFCIAVAGSVTSRRGQLQQDRGPFAFAALERILSPGEKIFTSMDTRPITFDRCRSVDPQQDSRQLRRLRDLACEVFLEFNLHSLIRLDIRSDADGGLFILEANPKPDLKRPANGIISLISVGLDEIGMDYDDLIFSLLADRLNFLLTQRPGSIAHVVDLLGPNHTSIPAIARNQTRTCAAAPHTEVTTAMDIAALNRAVAKAYK